MRTSNTKHGSLRRALSVVVCVGLLCAPLPVAAQASSDLPGYREAIEEAIAEHDAHNYLEAKSLFARAHAIYPNARTLRGLGAVSFELKQYADAMRYLEQALASQERPLAGELRDETERLLARARGFVAELRIVLTPADAHLLVDGSDEAYDASQPLLLQVGEHELEFRADGHRSERRRYVVQGGESKRWVIELAREGTSVPLVADTHRDARATRSTRVQRGIGGSLLALGLGALAGTLATNHERHRRADEFASTKAQTPEYFHRHELWSDVRLQPYAWQGASVSLLTAGAVLWVTSTERAKFPLWASLVSGAAGLGLLAWGLPDVARGHATCGAFDVRACVTAQDQRDRGALVTMAALPLLAIPLTQLLRHAPPSERSTSVALYPSASARQLGFGATLRWF